jgi:uncharacterized phage protein (TIGR01671 family)
MRDIKFRYVYQHNETGRIAEELISLEDIETGDYDHDEYDGYSIVARNQFTGLTDVNGVDIYEGDVVKAHLRALDLPIRNETHIGSVSFQEFEWIIENASNDWPCASWVCVQSCEVIGKIHENPNLLAESDNG